jgi:hypothetical protein
MAVPTIVATVGSATANSFVTELEQITYMSGRLNNSNWTTVTGSALTADENKALLEATIEIGSMVFLGERVDTTQALSWPRQNVTDPDSPTASYYSSTVMPERVKNATMELAFQYINSGTTDVAAIPSNDGIKRSKIDVLETEYFEYGQPVGIGRYPRVMGFLSPLLASTGSLTAPLIKG